MQPRVLLDGLAMPESPSLARRSSVVLELGHDADQVLVVDAPAPGSGWP